MSGCTSSGTSPITASLQAAWPDWKAASNQAASIPYASVAVRLENVNGLLVMGDQAGDMSYWPSSEGVVLELYDGALHATAGLERNLLGTRYAEAPPWRQASPHTFDLTRTWEDANGRPRHERATGRMTCDPPAFVSLPLGEQVLERCMLRLVWAGGESTESVLWREPQRHHLWAVQETPWPGAPTMQWQVARHWW